MYIVEDTLDDLLNRVLKKLLDSRNHINPSKGHATELSGVMLRIRKPRARLSRTAIKGTTFSCLGELLWYLAGTDDLSFITYYIGDYKKSSDDGKTIYGAYGPRLFDMRGINQVENVIDLLRRKTDSRQAVIQLFDASDITEERKDVPCTCTLQFMIRNYGLDLIVNMRSNDAYIGLPHDVFAFTMLQEIIAKSLDIKLGTYKHVVGSLHLYEENRKDAQRFLDEGWQSSIIMPEMPKGDPWASIDCVLKAEAAIRTKGEVSLSDLGLDLYWIDLVRLLQIFAKTGNEKDIQVIKKSMSTKIYDAYIDKRQAKKRVAKRSSSDIN